MTPKHNLLMALLCLCHNIIFNLFPKLRFKLFLPIFIILIAFQINVLQAQTQKKIRVLNDYQKKPISEFDFKMNGKNHTTNSQGIVEIDESEISKQVTEVQKGYLIKLINQHKDGITIIVKEENPKYTVLVDKNESLEKFIEDLNTRLKQKEDEVNNLRAEKENLSLRLEKLQSQRDSLRNSQDLINQLNQNNAGDILLIRNLKNKEESLSKTIESYKERIATKEKEIKKYDKDLGVAEQAKKTVEETLRAKNRLNLTYAISIGLLLISVLLVILYFATKKNYKTVKELNEDLTITVNELRKKEEIEKKLIEELKIKIEELEEKKELEKAYKTIIKQHMELREKKEELEASETNLKATANALEAKTKDLEKTTQDLKRVQQEKEKFTRMVVHDFKNPLTTLLNAQSNPKDIRLAAQHIKIYVQDLQDVQNFEKGDFQVAINEYDLQSIAEEVIALLSSEALVRGIKLYSTVPKKSIVKCDKNVISRVLMNLVSNALKYTNEGEVRITVEEIGKQLRVSVKDTGIGIAEEKIEEIFKQGVTINSRKFGGISAMGIGLTFCDMALSKHHSTIRVESEVGKGTCFFFDLEKGDNYQTTQEEAIFTGYNEKEIQELKESMCSLLARNEKIKLAIMPKIRHIKNIQWYKASEIKRAVETIESNSSIVNTWKERLLEYRKKSYKTIFEELIDLNMN